MGAEKNNRNVFSIVKEVYSKTLGSEIIPVKFDDFHTKFATPKGGDDGIRAWMDTRKKDENRAVTEKHLERVKEIIGENVRLTGKDIFWTKNGKIAISTPDYTWKTLCGREWHVDLDSGTYELVAMS